MAKTTAPKDEPKSAAPAAPAPVATGALAGDEPSHPEPLSDQIRRTLRAEIAAMAPADLEREFLELHARISAMALADFKREFPELHARIAAMALADFKREFPELHARIVAATRPAKGTNLGEIGFTLAIHDPYALAVLRVYANAAGCQGAQLPAVLPFKDPATCTAVRSYIIRAEGAGDKPRADAAREALKQCKTK